MDDLIELPNMLRAVERTASQPIAANRAVLIEDILTKRISDSVDDRRAGNIQGLRELIEVDSQSAKPFEIATSRRLTRGYVAKKE